LARVPGDRNWRTKRAKAVLEAGDDVAMRAAVEEGDRVLGWQIDRCTAEVRVPTLPESSSNAGVAESSLSRCRTDESANDQAANQDVAESHALG